MDPGRTSALAEVLAIYKQLTSWKDMFIQEKDNYWTNPDLNASTVPYKEIMQS